MIVKVCGLTEFGNVRDVEAAGADLLGFVFYPESPRCVPEDTLPLSGRTPKTGVFVNESNDFILGKVRDAGLSFVQLHGNEPVGQCMELKSAGVLIIKAFSVGEGEQDIDSVTAPYEGCCEYFLFDTQCKGFGGSGMSFDWSVLNRYHGKTPFLLSGGLNPMSINDLARFSHPMWAGVDLNSGFETAPGIKDAGEVRRFIEAFRSL